MGSRAWTVLVKPKSVEEWLAEKEASGVELPSGEGPVPENVDLLRATVQQRVYHDQALALMLPYYKNREDNDELPRFYEPCGIWDRGYDESKPCKKKRCPYCHGTGQALMARWEDYGDDLLEVDREQDLPDGNFGVGIVTPDGVLHEYSYIEVEKKAERENRQYDRQLISECRNEFQDKCRAICAQHPDFIPIRVWTR